MKSIKFLLLIFIPLIVAQNCGNNDLNEEELVTLSVHCFNQRYNPDVHDGHKLSRIIDLRLAKYRKILQHIKMHNRKHIETSPVVKWAQTKQKIFINFKLSHRQDSPPCSDVRNQRFHIQNVDEVEGKFAITKAQNSDSNTSKFDFSSECFFTDQKFMFKLSMTFNAPLKNITLDREGFGTYTIVGEKQNESIWIDPFQDVQRAAIWPEMRERHSAAMNEYFEMRQKRLEESEQQKSKKKKKRRSSENKVEQKQVKPKDSSQQL